VFQHLIFFFSCGRAEAVRCDSCKSFYHMHCVQPPLAAKPAKGYGWSCAPCAKKHEDNVDRQGARSESPPRTSKTRLKAKVPLTLLASSLSIDVDKETIKYFKMWPFRYFGQANFSHLRPYSAKEFLACIPMPLTRLVRDEGRLCYFAVLTTL
jgi:hypothetical protein